jgi:hypothetical protein
LAADINLSSPLAIHSERSLDVVLHLLSALLGSNSLHCASDVFHGLQVHIVEEILRSFEHIVVGSNQD